MTTGQEGFEPPTPWFVATCSSPLSYKPVPIQFYYINKSLFMKKKKLNMILILLNYSKKKENRFEWFH